MLDGILSESSKWKHWPGLVWTNICYSAKICIKPESALEEQNGKQIHNKIQNIKSMTIKVLVDRASGR